MEKGHNWRGFLIESKDYVGYYKYNGFKKMLFWLQLPKALIKYRKNF